MRTFLPFLVLALAAGCDQAAPPASVDAGSDAPMEMPDVGTDAGPFQVADHPPLPVISDLGGARLRHPQLVLITFANDPNRAMLEANATWLVGSTWLTSVGAEYGIGGGSILANVERTDDAPTTIASPDIETLITAGIADHSLPMAANGTFDDVLYVIYFPEGTTITDPQLGQSCTRYGGYHSEAPTPQGRYAYAVIPNCPHFFPGLNGLESEQVAFSHEVIEAATDPRPMSSPAWTLPETGLEVSPWVFIGAEVADLCALSVGPNANVREGGWLAARIWSNAAAQLGDRDPCIPAAATSAPYYTVTAMPDSAQSVAPGASAHFDLVAWTSAPRSAFQVYAASTGPATVDVNLDHSSMNNGDHATLRVTVPAGTPSRSYAVVYVGVADSVSEYHSEPVVVYVP